ncbi:MAG: DUF58 domain-containing protein [Planctomycetota bacterium]
MVARLAALPARLLRAVPDATLPGRYSLTLLLVCFWFAVFVRNNPVLLLVTGALAAVLLSALWTILSTGRLVVRRRLPRRVVQGRPFTVGLQVRNESSWRPALGMSFRDTLQKECPGHVTCSPAVPVLPPGGRVELHYETRVRRRGVYHVTHALAATRFPFGLFERRLLLADRRELIVLPALGVLSPDALRELRRPGGRHRRSRLVAPVPEDLRLLREYRWGDHPRFIHWRTSARAGKLIWRVYRGEEGQRLIVLLDTCVAGLHAETRRPALERAVCCAATVLARLVREQRSAGLLLPGRRVRRVDGTRALLPALESLAAVREGRLTAERAVGSADLRGSSVLLLSLQGSARAARRAAARHGVLMRVWDVSEPSFGRFFRLR